VQVSGSDTYCVTPFKNVECAAATRLFVIEDSPSDSRNGLGLGLFVCRDLIQRQGGVVWAASVLDHGTAICFTVPKLDPSANLGRQHEQ
jgi:signal transduction histidine kinase